MGTHRALRGGGRVDDTAWVDPTAYINGTASVGARSYVGAGVYVNAGVSIGADCIICDRVRITGNIADGTTIACDCCSGSGPTPPGGTVNIFQFDSINVVGSKLALFDTTAQPKGTLAYVGNDTFVGQHSVHRYYTLVYGEALTADGIEVVNSPTFGTDGAQWLSTDTVNQQAQQALFWAVDPANVSGVASDENTGSGTSLANAKLHPLRTFQELNRRNFGRNGTNQVQVTLMSSDTNTPIMNNFAGANGSDQVAIIGDMTQLGPDFVLTFYLPANPASNIPFNMAAPGLGAVGNLGKLVTNAAQTKWSTIVAVDGANGVTLSEPHNYNPLTFAGPTGGVAFTAGETVRVWNRPLLTQWPFPGDSSYPTVWHCRISGTFGDFDLTQFGNSSPQIVSCTLEGLQAQGGTTAQMVGNSAQLNDCVFGLATNWNWFSSSQIACDIYFMGGNVGIYSTHSVHGNGATFYSTRGASLVFGVNANLAIFNNVVNGCEVQPNSDISMDITSYIYGNLAKYALKVWSGAHARVNRLRFPVVTSNPAPIALSDVEIAYVAADLPVSDPEEVCGISTWEA